MSKMKIKVTGSLDRVLIKSVVKAGGRKGTWSALDYLATESKKQVPLDQGPLMHSCVVDVNEDGSEGTVSYDEPYAIVQHENMQFRHQRGRKAKYLEDPCNDKGIQENMVTIMQRSMSEEMR